MERNELLVQEMVHFLDIQKEKCTKLIDASPKGYMRYTKNHGEKQYYWIRKNGNALKRVSIKNNTEMQKALAKKAFAMKMLEAVNEQSRIIDDLAGRVRTLSADEIIKSLPKAYRELPRDYFLGPDMLVDLHLDGEDEARIMRHKDWGEKAYEKSAFKPEGRKHRTSLGFSVRSKSEQLIVEQLASTGIPFHYEEVIRTGAQTLAPDFTFRDAAGRLFYWEHAGMMEDPGYAVRHSGKMKLYEAAGIVPWENLIVTYDKAGEVNMPMIKSIIQYEVMPRL